MTPERDHPPETKEALEQKPPENQGATEHVQPTETKQYREASRYVSIGEQLEKTKQAMTAAKERGDDATFLTAQKTVDLLHEEQCNLRDVLLAQAPEPRYQVPSIEDQLLRTPPERLLTILRESVTDAENDAAQTLNQAGDVNLFLESLKYAETYRMRSGALARMMGEKKETENGREQYIAAVLKDGGFSVHTAVEKSLSQKETGGYQDLENRMTYAIPSTRFAAESAALAINPGDVRRKLEDKGIHEMVTFTSITNPIYETITIPEKKGFLGRTIEPEKTTRRATGQREAILHSARVKDGKPEPAVMLTYTVNGSTSGDGAWRVDDGRSGQMLEVNITLPESVAAQMEDAITKDPGLIREIVARIMKEKILKDPTRWESPPQGKNTDALRPPYERWQKNKMYIHKRGTPPGWHEEAIKTIPS